MTEEDVLVAAAVSSFTQVKWDDGEVRWDGTGWKGFWLAPPTSITYPDEAIIDATLPQFALHLLLLHSLPFIFLMQISPPEGNHGIT